MCSCVEDVNKLIASKNQRVKTYMSLSSKITELIGIETEKVDSKSKQKAGALFASFCPFCGTSLRAAS